MEKFEAEGDSVQSGCEPYFCFGFVVGLLVIRAMSLDSMPCVCDSLTKALMLCAVKVVSDMSITLIGSNS